MKILVIEDSVRLADTIAEALQNENYVVDTANDGQLGYEHASTGIYDMVILDLMLPKMNGYEVLSALRRDGDNVPVLILSAKTEIDDKIQGFTTGADDYMTKPFSPNELVARVKAHISRYDTLTSKSGDVITVGKLMIDKDAHKVTVDGKEISLTAKEYDLLLFLAENPNHTFSKEVLFDRIWGMDAIGDVSTVTVHIQRVRDKINTENERYIETIWGVGYRFNI